jgi:hypothetical protein
MGDYAGVSLIQQQQVARDNRAGPDHVARLHDTAAKAQQWPAIQRRQHLLLTMYHTSVDRNGDVASASRGRSHPEALDLSAFGCRGDNKSQLAMKWRTNCPCSLAAGDADDCFNGG